VEPPPSAFAGTVMLKENLSGKRRQGLPPAAI